MPGMLSDKAEWRAEMPSCAYAVRAYARRPQQYKPGEAPAAYHCSGGQAEHRHHLHALHPILWPVRWLSWQLLRGRLPGAHGSLGLSLKVVGFCHQPHQHECGKDGNKEYICDARRVKNE